MADSCTTGVAVSAGVDDRVSWRVKGIVIDMSKAWSGGRRRGVEVNRAAGAVMLEVISNKHPSVDLKYVQITFKNSLI